MHSFEWARKEWEAGRSAVRKRWDNTAECYVDKSTRKLVNITRLGERITTMRQLDFDDITAKDWMSGDSNSTHPQTLEHVAV